MARPAPARRATGVAGAAALLVGLGPLTGDARAARSVSASFGVLGVRTVHATATTSGVPGGERIVLEGRRGASGRTSVRATGRVRARVARLRWAYPPGRGALHLRVRVVRGAGARTLAASPWRTLRTGNLRRAAPLASVRLRDVERAPPPGASGDLVLRGAPSVAVGDVVALPAGPAAPEGLLVRVREVRRGAGGTVAVVRPATLPEVVPVGDLDVSVPVPTRTAGTASVREGVFRGALPCAGSVPATITGRVSLSAGLALRTSWRTSTSLARANVTADLRADVRASVDAGVAIAGAASCLLRAQPVFRAPVRLHRISTSIGPLPITITADGRATVSGSASTLGRFSTAARGRTRGVARIVYDGIEAKARGSVGNDLRLRDTEVTASGGAETGVTPTVDVRFFGLPGSQFDIAAGVRTRGDILRPPEEPWWNAVVIDEVGALFRLGALRADLEGGRVRIAGRERAAGRASGPAGGSASRKPVAAPEPMPAPVRARVISDGADVDLHAWDAAGHHLTAFDSDAIPGAAIVVADAEGLTGEELRDPDASRPVTLGVCLATGTESNVTLDVREANGTTMRRAYTLRGRAAGALATVVPSGAAPFVPAPGWCGRATGDPSTLGEVTTGELPAVRR